MQGTDTFWIVRCPPARTLQLHVELKELGFEAWTPIVEREYRKARSRKYIRVAEPMLSSFIFVHSGNDRQQCAARLDDLRWQLGIRVMRENGSYASVRESDLSGLRAIEKESATFGIDNVVKGDNFKIGDIGSISSSAFMGLSCKLVGRTRGNLLVLLEDSQTPIKIKPALFCLLENEQKQKQYA